ncbi:MAG: hypothetical protein ACRD2G_14095 [Terriglobia bacterium]
MKTSEKALVRRRLAAETVEKNTAAGTPPLQPPAQGSYFNPAALGWDR